MRADADPAAVLREGLAQLGIMPAEPAQALLEKYIAEIERWNPRFGLVKYDGRQELIVKHVLDSLSAWTALREAASEAGAVLDVGSGAGFPGIPLAIALPDITFTLLERMARRAAFLETCAILLGLSRVKVIQSDLAVMTGEFDVVTCRAVAPLARLLEDIGRSAIRWRAIVAYKGKQERAREEIEEVERLMPGRFSLSLRPLRTPFLDEERCLAVLAPIRY
ncbi:MAG: 16S rRNA (guanine(527)-N(7))-methyltransferase RsmG [Spirochaetia bacterium]